MVLLFIAKGIALCLMIGPFTGHDEVDHFFYIERLAGGRGLGEFRTVLLPAEAAPYSAYAADYPYNAEVIQPPLYHLALAPIDAVLPFELHTRLLIFRLISVAIGAAVVFLTYALARELFPREHAVRAGAPVFVALQPQVAFEAAIVNHDIVVIALATLLGWLVVAWGKTGFSTGRLLWLGLILGAGILTKTSFGLMVPVLGLAIILAEHQRGTPIRAWFRTVAISIATGLLIASPWFVRSLALYGDPTGAQELRTIPGFADQAQSLTDMLGSDVFWRGRLEDFWGNYGWRLIPFDPDVYRWIYALWLPSGIGLLVAMGRSCLAWRRTSPGPIDRSTVYGLAILLAWCAAMIAGVLYVGTIQFTQSRFAFPAMAPLGILTSFGYASLMPKSARRFAPTTLAIGLIVLNVVTAVRFLMPFYAGSGGTPGVAP